MLSNSNLLLHSYIVIIFCVLTDHVNTITTDEESNEDDSPANKSSIETTESADPRPEGRMIGSDAGRNIPWQVYITIDDIHKCGGALVSIYDQQFVLSSARCFYKNIGRRGMYSEYVTADYENIHLYFGVYDRSNAAELQKFRMPKKIIIHEEFDPHHWTNDIAIIFLEDEIPIKGRKIDYIEIASHDMKLPSGLQISGWGPRELGGKLANRMRLGWVEPAWWSTCKKYDPYFTDRQVCFVGKGSKNIGMCSRDTGGPLIGQGNNAKIYLFGIMSYHIGIECDYTFTPNPGVATNIPAYEFWIRNKVQYDRP